MYVKKITYTDYNGESRTEPFYFNLNKGELIKMQLSKNGGYQSYLKRLLDTNNQAEIMEVFDNFIKQSYGVKSDDGKRFIKNQQVLDEFTQSEAYSELLTELISNEKAQLEFIQGLMPKEYMAQLASEFKNQAAEYGIDVSKLEEQ